MFIFNTLLMTLSCVLLFKSNYLLFVQYVFGVHVEFFYYKLLDILHLFLGKQILIENSVS